MLRRRLAFYPVASALLFAVSACGDTPPADPRTLAPLVRDAVVEAPSATLRTFTGIVSARVQSDLGFRVSGKVLTRLVDTGQTVKRGQVLMRLDAVDLKLAQTAQDEAVAAARARAVQTAQEENRYRDLRGTGAISASSYDQIKAAADAARAQLGAAQAQADVARNASRHTDLIADGDGVVLETLAEPGQVVSAGQPVLRLAHAGRREAIIQLPETLRPAVGSTAMATVFGGSGTLVTATLRQISSAADRTTRTFEARYVLGGEGAAAALGTTVTLRLAEPSHAAREDIQVPIGALYDAGKGPGVWRIVGNPLKVTWQPVHLRQLNDDSARIEGSLRAGDRIVALGAHLLREGDEVRIATGKESEKQEGTQHEGTQQEGTRP